MSPLYSQTKRLLTLFEIRVVIRNEIQIVLDTQPQKSSQRDLNNQHVNNVYKQSENSRDLSQLPVSAAIDQILGRNSSVFPAPEVSVVNADSAESKLISTEQHNQSANECYKAMEIIPDSKTFICQVGFTLLCCYLC